MNVSPIATKAAGDIATQTLLSLLINLFVGQYEESAGPVIRKRLIGAAEEMIDGSTIPDLPVEEHHAAREQAKVMTRALLSGVPVN